MVTRHLFLGFLGLLALQRLLELRLSRRNESWIVENGGVEHSPGQYKFMKLVHVSWFLAMIAEVYSLKRPFLTRLASVALLLTVIGQGLRYAAIHALGRRWSVRIFTIPNSTPVSKGIYHYIRHPNYLGVILEVLAVPLLHSAYLTSIFWSAANLLILSARIRNEERALIDNSSFPGYPTGRQRFIPEIRIRKDSKIESTPWQIK